MNQNTLKLSDGSIIGINDLGKNSSLKTVILQKTFLDLCEFVAFKYYYFNKESDSYKTLINSLFLKSNKLRTIGSIIEFNKFNDIEEVNFDIDLTDFNHFFTSKDIVFFGKTNANQQWINKSELVYSILKWLANKLYSIIYFFSGKQAEKNKSNTVIRSWVDDAEKIYKAEFKTSIILIYPFLLNPLRGLRYIRHCFKNYKYPVLVGIPYNFIDLIRIIFSKGVSFDGALIEFENKAMVKHANLFKDFNIIYTSDEYMVNSHVLHSILMQQSKKVINKAHGIGFYSPYVNYDEMHMYNENQINHYRTKNKSISYFILKEYIIDTFTLDCTGDGSIEPSLSRACLMGWQTGCTSSYYKVNDLVKSMINHFKFSDSCVILLFIYMWRLDSIILNSKNWKNILITLMMLVVKWNEDWDWSSNTSDKHLENKAWASFGQIDILDLNYLELDICKKIGWKFFVTKKQFEMAKALIHMKYFES
jgi:hypothetical protein